MSRDSIELHPTLGVNPRVTCCSRCGEDVGVALLGRRDWYSLCQSCGTKGIGLTKCPCGGRCKRTGETVGEYEKLPIELCSVCQVSAMAEQQRMSELVAEGGVYWRCSDCRNTGVIRGTSPLAQDVRKHLGVEAPEPCGAEFSKDDCPACGPDRVEAVPV